MNNLNANPLPANPRKRFFRRCLVGALVGSVVLVIGAGAYFTMTPLGRLTWWAITVERHGPFEREMYQEIVDRVRRLDLPAGQETRLRVDDFSAPETLRVVSDKEFFMRGQGAGTIWTLRDEDGNLIVTMETNDLGHAGMYGFAFSDEDLTPTGDPNGWMTLEVPGSLFQVVPEYRID